MDFFRSESVNQALDIIKAIFLNIKNDNMIINLGISKLEQIPLFISLIILLLIEYLGNRDIDIYHYLSNRNIIVRWIVYYIIAFSIIIFGVYGGNYEAQSFIYYQF